MIKQDFITKIMNAKIKPKIDYEIGREYLTKDILQKLIDDLPSEITLLGNKHELNDNDKKDILEYILKFYGFNDVEHIYIKKGMGIFHNQDDYHLDKENWFFYLKHLTYLTENIYQADPEVVFSLDEETDQIIKKIPKPNDIDGPYSIKGMVIGHVQSGKTANFTHLISKAASIGYKFIIVLSGMTNTLRIQTQNRLNQELIGDSYELKDQKLVRWEPGEPKYRSLTTLPRSFSKEDGDFKIPATGVAHQFNNDDITIAIIKKLARVRKGRNKKKLVSPFQSIIGNLINWIEGDKSVERNNLPPLLIIDDEADQASVDGTIEEQDPTTINHAIRKLISLFPKSVYIGYTATPFANVFIDKDDEYLGLPNLYPKDFIYALPEPKQYFGTSKFFDITYKQNCLIKIVPDEEKNNINNINLDDVTESLGVAILDFIFAIIIKKYRNNNTLTSMLIHTDHKNVVQNLVFVKVKKFIFDLMSANPKYLFEKYNHYIADSKIIAKSLGLISQYPDMTCDEFMSYFFKILNDINSDSIKLVNGENESLDYSKVKNNIICIGGNLLSRGVTVEGLCISYYLRDSTKYDTLLQMARWFGYRKGYEDLLRIYTTSKIKNNFEYLIQVESDLRGEIARYIEEGVTPEEFAPKVRAHTKMMPTAKMGVSKETKSYSQHVVQTFMFINKYKELKDNYIHSSVLINENLDKIVNLPNQRGILLEGLDLDLLYNFMSIYNYHEKNFNVSSILEYIQERENNEINSFDLFISSLKKPRENSYIESFESFQINPVVRNLRANQSNTKEINLGVISDTNDIMLVSNRNRLTLVFYFIDYINSNAFNDSNTKSLVDSKLDFNPIGYALVFPKTNYEVDANNYYQQVFL